MHALKEQIIEKAHDLGIDKIGFASAEPFYELEDSLIEQRERGYTSGFEHQNIKERIYPELTFDNPQSFIAIAMAYPSTSPVVSDKEDPQKQGQFATASWGTDYHVLLKDRMDQLVADLQTICPDAHFKSMVDTGVFVDVAVAERAGLGFIGKNGLLITKEFGSYVYLGEILTDLKLPADERVTDGCGDCTRCIDYCPTGALLGDGRMNAKLCLSYQTQTKESMPKEFRKLIGSVIYGCDICQQVCPYNQGIDNHIHPEMEPVSGRETPNLHDMLRVSNREFREKFGELAGSWRGKKSLQRNSIIALTNLRDRSAIPLLLELIAEDPRPVIRETAAWGIGKLAKRTVNHGLLQFLEEQIATESDESVREELILTHAELQKHYAKKTQKKGKH